MPSYFQFREYDGDRGSNIGALMMAPAQARARALREAGAAQARAAEIGGQATAGAINSIGNIISGGFQQYAQEKANAPIREMQGLQLDAARQDAAARTAAGEREGQYRQAVGQGGGRAAVLARLQNDPELLARATEQFDKLDNSFNRYLGDVAASARAFDDSPDAAMIALDEMIAQGFDERRLDGLRSQIQGNPENVGKLIDSLLLKSPDPAHKALVRKPKEPEAFTLSEGQTRFGPDGKPVASVDPKKPAAPNVGSFEDYVTRFAAANGKTPEQLAPADIEQARKRYNQSDDRPRITVQTGAGGATLSPSMEANVLNRLTKQWDAQTAPARELDRQVGLMTAGLEAARRGDMAAGSQVILTTFQKVIDPPSVVRESEYMRSAAGQSLMSRVKGAYERLKIGGAGVRLDELEKFAKLAQEMAAAQRGAYLDAVKERIGKTADRYRIPRDLVFESVDPGTPPPATSGAPALTYEDYIKAKRKPGGGQ